MNRWQTIPEEDIPLRRELMFWRKGDAQRIRQWVDRQPTAVREWITERGARYVPVYAGEKPVKLWHEAAVDLLCWQRAGLPPRKAMDWLRDFDEGIREAR